MWSVFLAHSARWCVALLVMSCVLGIRAKQRRQKVCPQIDASNHLRPKQNARDPEVFFCQDWRTRLCNEFVTEGVVSPLSDKHGNSNFNPRRYLKAMSYLTRNRSQDEEPLRFASSSLARVSPMFYFTEAVTLSAISNSSQCRASIELSASDQAAWSAGVSELVRCFGKNATAACSCSRVVVCWTVPLGSGLCPPLELRIVGLVLERQQRRGTSQNISSLAALQHLLFLDTRRFENPQLPELPLLRTLLLGLLPKKREDVIQLPRRLPSNLRWLTLSHTEQQGNGMPLPPMAPEALAPVCEMKQLQTLSAARLGLVGLPPCLGTLSDLLAIDVRGNLLGSNAPHTPALPVTLENLTNLVTFVAFEQGILEYEDACPSDLSYRPTFETIKSPENGQYRCPGCTSWAEDLNTLPIFKWHSLELFWADANSLWATPGFFRRAAGSWPRLRTFDLYDNNLTSDIQEVAAFAGHRWLEQVQLQYNDLAGVFPAEILNGTCPLFKMDVQLNKRLKGCVHPGAPSYHTLDHTGTSIRIRENCPRALPKSP